MPPRRRTFYLADATALSNTKVRRLQRDDRWLSAWGAFHILIGVATLEDDPTFTEDECEDLLGAGSSEWALMLRGVGLMDANGLDPATFEEWKPKPRPRYPSDGVPRSQTDSGGVRDDYAEKTGMPTSSSSSTSSTASSSSSRGAENGHWDQKVAATLERDRGRIS